MLEQAIQVATLAHSKQKDKVGEPYILHPLRVMMTVQGEIHRTVAVLHDVIEDTYLTESSLRLKFTKEVADAVVALSREKDEGYDSYIQRVLNNEIAKVVKIADVKDNASPARLYRLDPPTIKRLTDKYSKVLKVLEGWK